MDFGPNVHQRKKFERTYLGFPEYGKNECSYKGTDKFSFFNEYIFLKVMLFA
jgi:hypothetical protein